MKKICFFNHYHNGDLFHGKSFIREIMYNVDTEIMYAHRMNPLVLADMDIKYETLPNIPHKARYLDLGDTLLINTWIGAYFGYGIKYDNECTLRFTHQMYARIYDLINRYLPDVDLVLGPVNSYVPFVNYNKITDFGATEFVVKNKHNSNKNILISNGPCHSGQCQYNGDMKPIIESMAEKNTDKTFVATHKFDTSLSNIKFTSDIIDQSRGCDLNEISYLSTVCDLIIGRNSGPFCFAVTDVNVNNPNKAFYSFGENETLMFMHGIETPAKFIFDNYTTIDNIHSSISRLVEDMK